MTATSSGGTRLDLNAPGLVADHHEAEFFTQAPEGRAVICEDGDEYGVTFQVWQLSPKGSECLYRAYVPYEDGETDPSTLNRTIVGSAAAAAAADLYDADPGFLIDLEADPSPVRDSLGIIGTPFMPWLRPLDISWPEPW